MNDRVTDLEVKAVFLEQHVHELDDVVRTLVEAVRRLEEEVTELGRQVARSPGDPADEEPPPHYGRS